MMKLILASNSPRRKELLAKEGFVYEVFPADIDETMDKNKSPKENVLLTAIKKAKHVYENNKDACVIAADTIVVINNNILGKPKNKDNAKEMLSTLSGNTHQVMTGVSIINKEEEHNFVCVSDVTFYEMNEEDIIEYIETGEPMDKAGAYGIQGIGRKFIKSYTGEFENIMGLPIKEVKEILIKIK